MSDESESSERSRYYREKFNADELRAQEIAREDAEELINNATIAEELN